MEIIITGGVVGSGVAYMTSNNFKPVSQVLVEMDEKQKAQLYDKCCTVIKQLDWSDTAIVLQLIMADAILTTSLLDQVTNFLNQQFQMQIDRID